MFFFFRQNARWRTSTSSLCGIFPGLLGLGSRDPGWFCLGSWDIQSILAWDGESQTVLLRDLGDGNPGVFKLTPESSRGTSEISLVGTVYVFMITFGLFC